MKIRDASAIIRLCRISAYLEAGWLLINSYVEDHYPGEYAARVLWKRDGEPVFPSVS